MKILTFLLGEVVLAQLSLDVRKSVVDVRQRDMSLPCPEIPVVRVGVVIQTTVIVVYKVVSPYECRRIRETHRIAPEWRQSQRR